jgi:hypothetical protein
MAFVPNMNSETVLETTMGCDPARHARIRGRRRSSSVARRRPTRDQGRGLELLGHAIEYLVDSDLNGGFGTRPAQPPQAAQMLMRLSREVFAECPEVVPFWRKVSLGVHRWFERRSNPVHVASAAGRRS